MKEWKKERNTLLRRTYFITALFNDMHILEYTLHQRKKERKKERVYFDKWAASWKNQENGMCAQRRLRSAWAPPSLIRVFTVRMKKAWVLIYPLSAHQRLWSDWAHLLLKRNIRVEKCRCVDIFCEISPKYLNVIIQNYQFCRPYKVSVFKESRAWFTPTCR